MCNLNRMRDSFLYILLIFSVSCAVDISIEDSFSEELLLKPLYTNKIYAHFQFTTKWNVDGASEKMYQTHLFPRALSEILVRHNVQELHISLTAGLWRYETWGYPVIDAAPGAELWVWFKRNTQEINKNWKSLANSLSGLLCASLNFIDSTNSISPEISLRPSGVVKDRLVNSTYLKYASLPREIVCTENLTPWKKLLPCDSQAGIASLLNAGYIHNTRYHSLGIHVRPVCADAACKSTAIELQQTVSLVYDYITLGQRNWSLRKLFGQGILGPCPLASESNIYVDVSSNASTPFELIPNPDEYIVSYRGGQENTFAKYNIFKAEPMSISAVHLEKEKVLINSPPLIYANQYKTGYGQQHGGIVTKLYNNHRNNLDVVLLQNIPWFVPIYLHTMKIEANGAKLEPLAIKYSPGKLRQKAHYLELVLKLPPKSKTSISIDFDFVFLKWQEYPPDANHGFYIGSSIVSAMLPLARNFTGLPQNGATISSSFNASRSGYLVRIRTDTIIITLPTPDFSMPYNVICLACTVVALAFGPLHNITTKRLILMVNKKTKFKDKIKKFFNFRKSSDT